MSDTLGVWSFTPDWSQQVSEVLEFMTAIYTSDTGAEQRQMLRLSPRRSFEYQVLVFKDERTYFDLFCRTYGGAQMLAPIVNVIARLAADAAEGATTLTLDRAADIEFANAGNLMLIGPNPWTTEQVEVTSGTGSTLTLNAPGLQSVWPSGTLIMPAKTAKLTDPPQFTRQSDQAMSSTVRYLIDGANDYPVDTGALGVWNGVFVLTLPPDEIQTLTYGTTHMTVTYDNKTGGVFQVDTAGVAFTTQAYRWTVFNKTAEDALRGLFYALAGQLNAIWLPTFYSDFTLTRAASIGDDDIYVRQCGYGQAGGPTSGRTAICIFLRDGTRVYASIFAVAEFDDEEALTLASPLVVTLDPVRVERISFMTMSRAAQDTFEIDHMTDGVSTTQVSFKECPVARDGTPWSYTTTAIDYNSTCSSIGPITPPGPQPLQIVQTASYYDPNVGATGNNYTLVLDEAAMNGNLLVMIVAGKSSAYEPPGNWTTALFDDNSSVGNAAVGVYYKTVTDSDTSVHFQTADFFGETSGESIIAIEIAGSITGVTAASGGAEIIGQVAAFMPSGNPSNSLNFFLVTIANGGIVVATSDGLSPTLYLGAGQDYGTTFGTLSSDGIGQYQNITYDSVPEQPLWATITISGSASGG